VRVKNASLLVFLTGCGLLAGSLTAPGAETLFDFEEATELRAFHDEGRPELGSVAGKSVTLTNGFASSGNFALRFSTPKWKPGLPQWPAFECDPPRTNWAGFDRLILDVTNPGEHAQTLSLFITDGKVPTRDGLAHSAALPGRSYQAVTIHLAGLREKGVDLKAIRRIHFYTTEPAEDLDLRIDRVRLLRPGEVDAPLSPPFLRQLGALGLPAVREVRQTLARRSEKLRDQVVKLPGARSWVEQEVGKLSTLLESLERDLSAGTERALHADDEIARIKAESLRLTSLLDWRQRFEAIRLRVRRSKAGKDLVIGLASPMEKISPRVVPVNAQVTNQIQLSLARSERESFQVLAWAGTGTVRQVAVRVGDLRGPKGATLPGTNFAVSLMGYVKTTRTPPYGTPLVGWWPDPILEFTNTTDIAAGDVQSFWVRVHAPAQQAPGVYRGKLEVQVEGRAAFTFALVVRVFDFTLPQESPLPLAITFGPGDSPLPETETAQGEWRKSPDYPINAWKKHRARWAEFLSDYYLTYDSLYHREQPDFELLQTLAANGRLGRFNLGYYDYVPSEPGELEGWKTATLPRLRRAYARAKELGILSKAYIYGCDEVTEKFFPQVEKAAAILKQEFPGVLIMTTTYDHSFGTDSALKSVDAFCPLTPKFDPAKAAEARRSGKQVWWYICCAPHPPHANMFIELPAIEGRLLMGALAAKYRPDGFLYYEISIWNSQHCITAGPFTDWDPRSWTVYHGDGSWVCVGPDGTPLPTIRLENFRDGLEDYAYVKLLEQEIARVEALGGGAGKQWLSQAKTCLEVPAELVKSRTEYSRDPAAVYTFRQRLADAIEKGRAIRK
jgi:hypothetical protein